MGAREVEFSILGRLEATVDGRPVRLGGPRSQAVLAMLVVHHGQVLSIDRLGTAWGADPPVTVRNQVMIAVAALRRALREAGAEPEIIETVGSGYRLRGGLVDAHRAEALIEQARQASGTREALGRASELLGAALALWRGPVLAELDPEPVRVAAGRWEELRLAALEERAEVELALGRHRDLVGELAALLAAHPLRERVRELLMLALYRSGRQSESLEVYREGRRLLAAELGLDPGPELRRLEAAILAGDPALDLRDPPRGSGPAELPADVSGFVGRERELAELRHQAAQDGSTAAITGAAGMGKTALAVRLAHEVAAGFPDGQLYVDLRGHAPRPPMTPLEALTRMLSSLGVPAEQIPDEEEPAAALYRSRLSGRRMLVLLDDARTAAQVRPLLPGAPGCRVLITSRDALAGLAASHGVRRLSLGVLDQSEGLALLERVIGARRLSAEPEAAAEVVRLCAGLPLALRVAAATLATHPRWSLAEYGTALARKGLDLLQFDGDVAVRAAFGLSYAWLPDTARRMFRLLGLAPGPDITVPAAAALARLDVEEAERLLDALATAHLLDEHRPFRHTFHDLIRQYAKELAEQEDDPATRSRAVERLSDWYVAEATEAAELAHPSITRLPATRPPSDRTDRDEAVAWLADERPNLVAALVHAAGHGPYRHAWLLADALRGHFFHHSAIADCVVAAEAAVRAATAEDDPLGLAAAHLCAGSAAQLRSGFAAARAAYTLAARHSERAGWPQGAAAAYNNAAAACHDQGELRQATGHLAAALRINREIGNAYGEANALSNLGTIHLELGALGEAEEHLESAVAIHRRLRDSPMSLTLNELATVHRVRGDLGTALPLATQALERDRTSGSRVPESKSLATLAEIHRDAGRLDLALDHALQADARAEEAHHLYAMCLAANVTGTVHTLQGDHGRAVHAHERALGLSMEADMRYLRVRALLGLARAHLGDGDPATALTCADQALALARQTGYRVLEGMALTTAAAIHWARERPSEAAEQAQEAIEVYRELGFPIAEDDALTLLTGITV
ncbi:AfsR/SARP family transcriptional regulator [Nonomuraea zeae]|uniref:Tetratricopeptide repeat protein n=1 Tax=Nonomuraea zeae TaxID=1642303 RepID=A0A5S4GBK6_9ACTN|nr:BTAD domain-containing putative transcriptional regulator [Nonomuraea zeae]TMR29904.1 tetratricopeptide repeat protein [Nonomuraea zeae]